MYLRKKFFNFIMVIVLVTGTISFQNEVKAYEGQPLGTNVAYRKSMWVSDSSNVNDYNNPASVLDGDFRSGFQSPLVLSDDDPYYDPQQWIVDLGENYDIDKIVLAWEAAAAAEYDIYVSTTNEEDSWTKIVTETNGKAGTLTYDFGVQQAKYVKLDLKKRAMTQYGYKLFEIEVYTVGSVTDKEIPNLALQATATASVSEGGNTPDRVKDENHDTFWGSDYFDPSVNTEQIVAENYITLEWPTAQQFNLVKIDWRGGYMKGYKLQISNDGSQWEDVYTVYDGVGSEYRICRFDPKTAKYLRLQGTAFGAYRFEVAEIEVYDETQVGVESLNLNMQNLKLDADKPEASTYQLTYLIGPANAFNQEVQWSSSSDDVATVSDTGLVTAVNYGTATITATSVQNPNVKATCQVSVSKELAKSVVTASRLGKTGNISVSWTRVSGAVKYILTRNNINDAMKYVVYEGTDTAYTDKGDEGTGLLPGNYVYTVEAVSDEGNMLQSNSVSEESAPVLIPVDVESVKITEENLQLEVNDSVTLHATVYPLNATNPDYEWSSSNENIATVDENGTVTGVQSGNVTITVTTADGGYQDTCKIEVYKNDVTSVTPVGAATYNLPVGKTQQLAVKTLPATATISTVKWTSSNNAIATVDENGLVTAKSGGTAKIYATADSGVRAEFTINVRVLPTAVQLSRTSMVVYINESEVLTATVLPSNASNKNVTWVTSNRTIASVDANGRVTGRMAGTVYISAKTQEGNITAMCTVTVMKRPVTKPVKVKLKKLKKKNNTVTVRWKKVKDTVGYQVYMKAKKGGFKLVKTIKKAKTLKFKKKLKAGTYRFKVRAYKLDGEKKVYGNFSAVKKIKIK